MSEHRLRPITVKQAVPFVARVHRRLKDVQGAMWAVAVHDWAGVVGVALVGHPSGQWSKGEVTLSVLRVAVVEGHRNACSMLYGACSRAARAMGADNLVTYTHEDEHGSSLLAANWIPKGKTRGGEYHRPSRPRKKAIDANPKNRWFAPWSKRVAKESKQCASAVVV